MLLPGRSVAVICLVHLVGRGGQNCRLREVKLGVCTYLRDEDAAAGSRAHHRRAGSELLRLDLELVASTAQLVEIAVTNSLLLLI